MRVWDMLDPADLCGPHLLAQWRECRGLVRILGHLHDGKPTGYANHPETRRWIGHERPLWNLLHRTRLAMLDRAWNPMPVPDVPAWVSAQPNDPWRENLPPPWDDQLAKLRAKQCKCRIPEATP